MLLLVVAHDGVTLSLPASHLQVDQRSQLLAGDAAPVNDAGAGAAEGCTVVASCGLGWRLPVAIRSRGRVRWHMLVRLHRLKQTAVQHAREM